MTTDRTLIDETTTIDAAPAPTVPAQPVPTGRARALGPAAVTGREPVVGADVGADDGVDDGADDGVDDVRTGRYPRTTVALGHSLPALAGRATGTVRRRGQAGYAELVSPWNLAVTMGPDAVVAAADARDVALTVAFATDHGCSVGVQATGHGAHASFAGHVMVVTRGLDELTVHPEGWARVGAGVKWGRVVEAAAPLGLTPVGGSTGDVGVVGYLTGGGVGPMASTYGLSADLVRAFDVVTGDGELRRVTPTEHPDLFWALRGGKGAVGIVTAVEVDLVPLTTFHGGAMFFAGEDAAVVLERWADLSQRLPEQGTTSLAFMQLPDAPSVPPPLAGRLTVAVRLVWTGDEADGVRWADELRAMAPVLLDDVRTKPAAAIDSVHMDPTDPMPGADAGSLLGELGPDARAAVLALAGPGSGSPQVMVELRRVDGALARPGVVPSAFCHRAPGWSVLAVGVPTDPAVVPHQQALLAALAPFGTGGVWPNFAPAHDAAGARRAYDAETLERLARVVDRYDPLGVLSGGDYVRAQPVGG